LKKFFKDELILKFIWKNKWFKTEELWKFEGLYMPDFKTCYELQ
jgi:hypothetical protein